MMNIIVISFDKLRYDAFAFCGNQQVFTPNFDHFAFDGWTYGNIFASASDSITNRYDIFHNTTGKTNIDSASVSASLFDILNTEYHKHLIYETPEIYLKYPEFINSFDSWMSVRGCYSDKFWNYDDMELPENWEYKNELNEVSMGNNESLFNGDNLLKSYSHSNRFRQKEEDWTTSRLFLLTGQFLKDNASRDNLFLWVDSAGMSDLWEAPEEILKLYQPSNINNGRIDPRVFRIQNGLDKNPSLNAIEMLIAGYYARITFLDRWIGILLKTILSIGMNDDTAIIITSMSGHKFPFDVPEPINNHENSNHIPLMIKIPKCAHQKDITPISSNALYQIISAISSDKKNHTTSSAYTNRNNNTIICAASPVIENNFAVTDGMTFTHFNDIDKSSNNLLKETALKFYKNRNNT